MIENSRTILVADDDMDDLEILSDTLAKLDPMLHVILARSGKEAVSLLSQHRHNLPKLILLDYNMPDITGPQVLGMISADARYADVPKVIWSTSDIPLYEQISREHGATHYFRKPDSSTAIALFASQIISLSR
jgi:CheY-like chemotaxis protein